MEIPFPTQDGRFRFREVTTQGRIEEFPSFGPCHSGLRYFVHNMEDSASIVGKGQRIHFRGTKIIPDSRKASARPLPNLATSLSPDGPFPLATNLCTVWSLRGRQDSLDHSFVARSKKALSIRFMRVIPVTFRICSLSFRECPQKGSQTVS